MSNHHFWLTPSQTNIFSSKKCHMTSIALAMEALLKLGIKLYDQGFLCETLFSAITWQACFWENSEILKELVLSLSTETF